MTNPWPKIECKLDVIKWLLEEGGRFYLEREQWKTLRRKLREHEIEYNNKVETALGFHEHGSWVGWDDTRWDEWPKETWHPLRGYVEVTAAGVICFVVEFIKPVRIKPIDEADTIPQSEWDKVEEGESPVIVEPVIMCPDCGFITEQCRCGVLSE